ncbi:hypothetical protein JTE90_020477 [Oedothorax gibbosus]|uniref:Uncharacterized protein n=1 Tax=Oedothorax gibbosus TaxID=931172 RepID=A0AAV6TH83_9ARAC|nr:hypothetical protein JTE90_020477 [Oedothorax gibbosus]
MKVQAGGGRPHSGSRSLAGGAHRRPAAFHLWKWRSFSAHVGTRKMVNYARTGRGQRKLWWRSVCGSESAKSIVKSGSSGVRLIENISSWFPRISLRIVALIGNLVSSGKAND